MFVCLSNLYIQCGAQTHHPWSRVPCFSIWASQVPHISTSFKVYRMAQKKIYEASSGLSLFKIQKLSPSWVILETTQSLPTLWFCFVALLLYLAFIFVINILPFLFSNAYMLISLSYFPLLFLLRVHMILIFLLLSFAIWWREKSY